MKKAKTNWFLVVVLLAVAGGLGYVHVASTIEAQDRKARMSEINRLETARYTKPEIGMLMTKLLELCGKDTGDFRETETRLTKMTVVTYKATPERKKKGCVGRFTFADYQLEMISD